MLCHVIAPHPPPRGVEGNLEEARSRCARCTRVASSRQTQRERPRLSPSNETERDRSADPLPYAETKEAWMQVLRSLQAFAVVHGVVIYPSIALGSLGSKQSSRTRKRGTARDKSVLSRYNRSAYRKCSEFLQSFIAPSASRGQLRYLSRPAADSRSAILPPRRLKLLRETQIDNQGDGDGER